MVYFGIRFLTTQFAAVVPSGLRNRIVVAAVWVGLVADARAIGGRWVDFARIWTIQSEHNLFTDFSTW